MTMLHAPASDATRTIEHALAHAAHLLPAQGPLDTFVHHNTLHAFEHLPFERAVVEGGRLYGCEPYLDEARYHAELVGVRITLRDLDEAVTRTLGDRRRARIEPFGSVRDIRIALVRAPLARATDVELHWLVDDTAALARFDGGTPDGARSRILEDTARLVDRARRAGAGARGGSVAPEEPLALGAVELTMQANRGGSLETVALGALWRASVEIAGDADARPSGSPAGGPARPGTGVPPETDERINGVLIPFLSAFLDQGIARWSLPDRDLGLLRCFCRVMTGGPLGEPWLAGLSGLAAPLLEGGAPATTIAARLLEEAGVPEADAEHAVLDRLLALRGWAGMLWRAESDPGAFRRPAPAGSLAEYLVVRLLLERLARGAPDRATGDERVAPPAEAPSVSFLVFQLAQRMGWTPSMLFGTTRAQRRELLDELAVFTSLERRRVLHLAYERNYRERAHNAIAHHAPRALAEARRRGATRPCFQVVCCIDEREESFRRSIEEIEPNCETLGLAGFFGVAMNYRGIDEARFRPLCPVGVHPRHHVVEEPLFSFEEVSRRQAEVRQRIARAAGCIHHGHHSLVGGAVAGAFGLLATAPLIETVLFPRWTSRLLHLAGRAVLPPMTVLRLERSSPEPGSEGNAIGYTVEEMADIVSSSLRVMGMTAGLARIVLIMGHGSSSRNNPHRAAYDCGACGGGRGGPNARAFARMANDPRVRAILAKRGLEIPTDTVFVGAYHNTCNEDVVYYDLDTIPPSHRAAFVETRRVINEARIRNAHERCRRFDAAPKRARDDRAWLWHLQTRAEDLSQVRPEYGHGSNAACLVGRRAWSRGLFLDRRAFLTSYDPAQDPDGSLLAGLLGAVVPVCAGISLEYYFSTVDQTGYGCGTKLPHNVAGLLGVMNGTVDDLRPGLPYQTVEIHEPMRLLMVVEAPAARVDAVIASNDTVRRIVDHGWIQFACLDPDTGRILDRIDGGWAARPEGSEPIPVVPSSRAWYEGKTGHAGFASVLGGTHAGDTPAADAEGGDR